MGVGRFGLICVHEVRKAMLTEDMKNAVREELFKKWSADLRARERFDIDN
jgi:hypothetical protein